jgi:phosphohistidine phosphatase
MQMKQILIMRHAKSDWSDGTLRDFDRPLNDRGILSAPAVGSELKRRNIVPELIISSPACRAKMTAEAVAQELCYERSIIFNEGFYFGYTGEILQALRSLDENVGRVMIFGHNPTFSSFTELLTGRHTELSTADVVILEFSGEWRRLTENSCKQIMYISSKELI